MNCKQEVSSEGKSDNYFSTWTKLKKKNIGLFLKNVPHWKSNTDFFIVLLHTNVLNKSLKKIWHATNFSMVISLHLKKNKYLESTAAFHDKYLFTDETKSWDKLCRGICPYPGIHPFKNHTLCLQEIQLEHDLLKTDLDYSPCHKLTISVTKRSTKSWFWRDFCMHFICWHICQLILKGCKVKFLQT